MDFITDFIIFIYEVSCVCIIWITIAKISLIAGSKNGFINWVTRNRFQTRKPKPEKKSKPFSDMKPETRK